MKSFYGKIKKKTYEAAYFTSLKNTLAYTAIKKEMTGHNVLPYQTSLQIVVGTPLPSILRRPALT